MAAMDAPLIHVVTLAHDEQFYQFSEEDAKRDESTPTLPDRPAGAARLLSARAPARTDARPLRAGLKQHFGLLFDAWALNEEKIDFCNRKSLRAIRAEYKS